MSRSTPLVGEPYMPSDAALSDRIRRAIAEADSLRRLEPRLVKITSAS